MKIAFAALVCSAAPLFAQPAARPAYEVASVKPSTAIGRGEDIDGDRGQIVFSDISLERLVEIAYRVKSSQVAGPAWLNEERFDIMAKYPRDASTDERKAMLLTLLEDRFQLATHREPKDVPGYAMVIAKSGFKLKPVEGEGNDTEHSGGRIQTLSARGTSMAGLSDELSMFLNAVVVDQTGLDGVYHFDLRWDRADNTAESRKPPDDVPTLFEAVEETLGIHLQPQKLRVDVVVVDHAERVPVGN